MTSRKKNKSQTGPKPRLAIVPETLAALKKLYPDAHCELSHRNAYELLIATILSAQCTDDRVNKVTPDLFERFPTPHSLAQGPLPEIEHLIKSINFFRTKAKNLQACAAGLVSQHQGEVPADMDQLVELAGVGRKTANCVLGNVFNLPVGVVVDTHVARLSNRFGWSREENPIHIERDLMKCIPKEEWVLMAHLLIFHGRRVCKARNPDCEKCFLFDLCPRRGVK